MKPLEQHPSWLKFCEAAEAAPINNNPLRVIEAAGLSVDLTGQAYSEALQSAGERLLADRQFTYWREALLSGAVVNVTENRAAWHSMLRKPAPLPEVTAERSRLNEFIRQADSERRWRNIIHIGIGGSDWGVRLTQAAFGYAGTWRRVRFASNIDGHSLAGAMAGLDPKETLIVIASKSFTTAETLQNAEQARQWLLAAGISDISKHVAAITSRPDLAQKWGIAPSHIFTMWDWVGGRFSLWSSVSLTTGLAVSVDVVAGMQAGAAAMDAHFASAPLAKNAPVAMALAGIVNRSVLNYGSLNIAPYDARLGNLVPYLQQLEMESLGKSVDTDGNPVAVPTGPVVWGMPGTDGQHTFFQWLHQGSDGAPVDFIVCQTADHTWADHHRLLLANCLAQREALMTGKSYEEALDECRRSGLEADQAQWLAKHRVHPGGRPTSLIVLPRLSPYTLGALLALYEHKVFVQGVIWCINPFDQWGVEYGKVLADGINQELRDGKPTKNHDASTAYWLEQFVKGS